MGMALTAPKPQRFLAWDEASPAAAWSLGLPFSPGTCGHPRWFIRAHQPLNPAINTAAEAAWTRHVSSCMFHLPVRYGMLLEQRDEGWQGLPCAGCPPPKSCSLGHCHRASCLRRACASLHVAPARSGVSRMGPKVRQ